MAEHLFRKKPVVVKAHHLGENESVEIRTLEGTLQGKPGDWVITGVEGEQYPCKDSIFRATYEPVVDTGAAVVPVPWPEEKRVLRIAHGFPCPVCQAHLLLDIRGEGVQGDEQKEG